MLTRSEMKYNVIILLRQETEDKPCILMEDRVLRDAILSFCNKFIIEINACFSLNIILSIKTQRFLLRHTYTKQTNKTPKKQFFVQNAENRERKTFRNRIFDLFAVGD